jgi:hypothetical protein
MVTYHTWSKLKASEQGNDGGGGGYDYDYDVMLFVV